MIREYKSEDKSVMMRLLLRGVRIVNQEDEQFLFCEDNKILIYELEEKGIVGFISFGRWGEDKKNGKIFLYVVPEFRRRQIGTHLYNAIMEYTKSFQLNLVEAVFRVDEDDATSYFVKRGFKKWYGLHVMSYNKGSQPVNNMEVVPYEDCFFEQYIDGIRNGFYEMRKACDFKPYYCINFSEEQRQQLQKDKDNIYVLVVDGKLAASAAVHTDLTDALGPVFVAPVFQGKGYGKVITQFAINEAIHRGMENITLEVVEWNKRAVNLYESLGFEMIQTTNSFRLFLK